MRFLAGGLRYRRPGIHPRVALIYSIFLLCLLVLHNASGQTMKPTVIHVHADQVRNRITPWMIGSCIEDVNHEIYGGLYAQQIFGESFEEPPAAVSPLAGWTAYGGQWRVQDGALHVTPDAGAKLVREDSELRDGRVECDVRLSDDRAGNAALILRVSDPRVGADNWIGYEISLIAREHQLAVSRHHNDWHLLKTVPAPVQAGQWYHVRVELSGPTVRIYLDNADAPNLEYTDDANAILTGKVGLRTWNTDAAFRNLVITSPQKKVEDRLDQADSRISAEQVSGMWDAWHTGDATARYIRDGEHAYNTKFSQQIEHGGGTGFVGIANRGLNRWGIAVRQGKTYAGSLALRQQGYRGRVTIALQSADGSHTYAQQSLSAGGSDWTLRAFSLRSNTTDPNGRFALWIDRPGTVWVDQVYLSPTGKDLFHGLPVRADIAKALKDQGLKFLRYGGTMVNAPEYRWKQMIGPRPLRPQYNGTWYPHSTNGFGIEEFVQLCEAAQIEPAFAIHIEETPQDAADLVDYLNGPVTSVWGKKRAENGHPKPYNVRFIQIGNEEAIDGDRAKYAHYLKRFHLLYEAMHPHDPKLQLVIAAWWRPEEPLCKKIMQELNGKAALWDVHVGGDGLRDGEIVDRDLTQMQKLFQEWAPGSTMKACIFEENGGRHDFQRALGHAHILNVTRRHGDFVLMDCPANCLQPWKQNDNGWDQGQVFFTPDKVWGMPPFYAQHLAALTAQPLCVKSEQTENATRDLDVTAMRSENRRELVLSVVNLGDTARRVEFILHGSALPDADVLTLTGDLTAINMPGAYNAAEKLSPPLSVKAGRLEVEFAPHSYTVLHLKSSIY